MGILSSLTREQKEAVGLLQIGTFLEYFDLMLYVHMAVLLNELFFPKTDPQTAALLSAFAFCSTYVLRPFGALLFGWIGDNIGRKPTVIITTSMMAFSCILIANIPTYEQVGILAAWLITGCRIMQGLTSLGEITASEVYLTETIQEPQKIPVVATLRVVDDLGSFIAIVIAALVTVVGLNWRIAFWFGATIAVIGSIARIRLRESSEFVIAKHQNHPEVDFKWLNAMAYFFIQAAYPYFFYVAFILCGDILKSKYGYTASEVIQHNLYVALIAFLSSIIYVYFSTRINSLTILKYKAYIALIISLITPFQLITDNSSLQIMVLQGFVVFFALSGMPAQAIFLKRFPVLKRMRSANILYAVSRAIMLVITSLGSIYLLKAFNFYGLWLVSIPVCLSFLWGVNHFIKLEKASGNFPEYRVSKKLSSIR
jgi:MHS family proline/betaine transporter-like MFS transporter